MAKLNVPIRRLVATPGALETIRRSVEDNEHTDELAQAKLLELVGRHARGDWGEVCKGDAKLNDEAAASGMQDRVLSSYLVGGKTVWIITDAGAAVTTVLLPEDY